LSCWFFRYRSRSTVLVSFTAALVVAGAANAAGSRPRTSAPIYSTKNPAICVETRGSRETIGDINALRSCKVKPGSIPVTFEDLFGAPFASPCLSELSWAASSPAGVR
jgi:hypothetical protein